MVPLRRRRCFRSTLKRCCDGMHNWWSVEYETAGLGSRGLCRSVVSMVAKASGLGFKSPVTSKLFSHFSLAFFPDLFR